MDLARDSMEEMAGGKSLASGNISSLRDLKKDVLWMLAINMISLTGYFLPGEQAILIGLKHCVFMQFNF